MPFEQLSRKKYKHHSGKFTLLVEANHSQVSLFQTGIGRVHTEIAYDLSEFLKEPSLGCALCSPNQGVRETAQSIRRMMESCEADWEG